MAGELFSNSDFERIDSDELNSLIENFTRPIDVGRNSNEFNPSNSVATKAVCKVPGTAKWSGLYNFTMSITPEPNQKAWVYSTTMEKVFINIFTPSLPVEFAWDNEEPQLFVRALPVYFSSEFFMYPVTRCLTHRHNKEVPDLHPEHVVRCTHPGSLYEKDEVSERFSVIAPLIPTESGRNKTVLEYKFMCKNSDVGGMNRRPIFLIFTLERENGEVIGRQTLKVRICSCPKRDKEKEENNKLLLEENNIPLETLAMGDQDNTSSSEEDDVKQGPLSKMRRISTARKVKESKKPKDENIADDDDDKIYNIQVFSHRWYKLFSTIMHDYIVGHAIHHNIEFTPVQQNIIEKLKKTTEE